MAGRTPIEWTDATWNPTVGCTVCAAGCRNCYAMRMAARLEAMGVPHYAGTTRKVNGKAVWTGKIAAAPDHILTEPLRWRKPRRIFVNSMSDLFHEAVPDAVIDRVFAVMAMCPRHTFQVLTKRPARMRAYLSDSSMTENWANSSYSFVDDDPFHPYEWDEFPLPNVWLGTSVSTQADADATRETMRALSGEGWMTFVSYEPALGPVDWTGWEFARWIISGGESGPDARPSHPDWHRAARDFCARHGIAYFFKQWGEWLVGEPSTKPDNDGNVFGLPLAFQDGGTFDVNSDGEDIVFAAALDEKSGPRPIWREYHGWHGHLIKRVGKKLAGATLDGREHREWPVPQRKEEPASFVTCN